MATPASKTPEPRRGDHLFVKCSGRGPVAVLVHGVAGSHLIWDPLVPLLEPHYTVVRIDLPGYGNSAPLDVASTPDALVDAVRSTLHTAGLTPPYQLVGLSMGANVVLAYAATHPDEVSGLTGIGFPYFPDPRAARAGLRRNGWTFLPAVAPRLASVTLPVLWRALRRSGLTRFHRGIYTPEMAYDALRVDYRSFVSCLDNCMIHFPYERVLEATAAQPRVFIHGGDDRWAPATAVARAVTGAPNTEFVRVEHAPHNLVVTRPSDVAAAIGRHRRAAGAS